MSTNEGKIDPRIRRTRDRLGDALVELLQEKPFDTITVQDVLDRAGVGRSTFYVHYRDKDDLFISDVDEFWEAMATMLSHRGESSHRIAPVRELFAHIAESGPLYGALVESGRINDVMELGQAHFARAIEQRFGRPPAVAHALAGALMSLLMWWIERGMRESPAEMDDLYHSIMWTPAGAQR